MNDDIGVAYRGMKADRDQLLAALRGLRRACELVRPFAGTVARPEPDVRQVLDAMGFIEAIAAADAALAKVEAA